MDDALKKVHETYREVQLLQQPEKAATVKEMRQLSENWKNDATPALQRKVVEVQLENLRNGIKEPVFLTLIQLLRQIPLSSFSILDAACASGYYLEVIRTLDARPIEYRGCDYSESMIQSARFHYPEINFEVQDLTALKYDDQSFDVVMASGVLEHIPEWTKAISELCRVARHYVIHHRCPLTPNDTHEYTIGSQYNIETPRIFFSKEMLVKEFLSRGFHLTKQLDVYNPPSLDHKIRRLARLILRREGPKKRLTQSFLYKRYA